MPTGLFYAGVGSRRTPAQILSIMTEIAVYLRERNFIFRSGGATGADQAFEAGAGSRAQIFLPWNGFNQKRSPYNYVSQAAIDTVAKYHPAPQFLSAAAIKLMARNAYQVLGPDLKTPSKFLVCWTPDGCITHDARSIQTGGTGQAISIACDYGIQVINIQRPDHLQFVLSRFAGKEFPQEFGKIFP